MATVENVRHSLNQIGTRKDRDHALLNDRIFIEKTVNPDNRIENEKIVRAGKASLTKNMKKKGTEK